MLFSPKERSTDTPATGMNPKNVMLSERRPVTQTTLEKTPFPEQERLEKVDPRLLGAG